MTRVLFVNYSNLLGGAERSLLDLLSALPRDRFYPALLTVGEGPLSRRAADMGVRCLSVASKVDFEPFRRDRPVAALFGRFRVLPDLLGLLIRIRIAVRAFAPQVIHSNNPKSHWLASLATTGVQVRRIFHFRDIFPAEGPAWRLFGLLGRLYRPGVAAISGAVRDALPSSLRDRAGVVYNGFPLPAPSRDRAGVRDALGIPGDAVAVLAAGRIVPWKKFERVIRALQDPLRKGDCFLVIAGEAEYWEADYQASLKEQVRVLGLTDRVRFAGQVADMSSLYTASDCFVLASEREPFGRVLVEAMLCGLPVAAFDEAGPAEIVEHNRTGLLCPPGDEAALGRALARFIDDPALRRRLGEAARTEAARRFSLQALAESVEALYEEASQSPAMKTSNRLFKIFDRIFGCLLAPVRLFRVLMPKRSKPGAVPRKILVCKLCCFGDGVLSLMALTALKQRHPSADMTVLASRRTQALFERCRAVDRVLVLPVSGVRGVSELLAVFRLPGFVQSIIRGRYDTLLDFDVYYRFTTSLSLLAGSAYSAGFETFPGRARLYARRVARPWNGPEWRLFFGMITPLDVGIDDSVRPKFRIAAAESEAAAALLSAAPPGALKVGLVLGSSPNWPEKEWPAAHFAQFMRLFGRKRKAHFFLIGTAGELTRSRELVKLYGGAGVTDLTGRTPFALLHEVMRSLHGLVSNDTGPMHLAALLGVPTVGLFGPTTETKWSPPGPFRALFASGCPLRPCYYLSRMPGCPDRRCLTGLLPERVAEAALTLIEGKQP